MYDGLATFDTMNVEKDGKVSWLEFRAFCTAVSDDNIEENNMNITNQTPVKNEKIKLRKVVRKRRLNLI